MHSQKSIGPKKANSIGTVGQIFFERAQCAWFFFSPPVQNWHCAFGLHEMNIVY